MNDLLPHRHGDEGTHFACKEMIKKFGRQALCCGCSNHACGWPITPMSQVPKQVQTFPSQGIEDWEKKFPPNLTAHKIARYTLGGEEDWKEGWDIEQYNKAVDKVIASLKSIAQEVLEIRSLLEQEADKWQTKCSWYYNDGATQARQEIREWVEKDTYRVMIARGDLLSYLDSLSTKEKER